MVLHAQFRNKNHEYFNYLKKLNESFANTILGYYLKGIKLGMWATYQDEANEQTKIHIRPANQRVEFSYDFDPEMLNEIVWKDLIKAKSGPSL